MKKIILFLLVFIFMGLSINSFGAIESYTYEVKEYYQKINNEVDGKTVSTIHNLSKEEYQKKLKKYKDDKEKELNDIISYSVLGAGFEFDDGGDSGGGGDVPPMISKDGYNNNSFFSISIQATYFPTYGQYGELYYWMKVEWDSVQDDGLIDLLNIAYTELFKPKFVYYNNNEEVLPDINGNYPAGSEEHAKIYSKMQYHLFNYTVVNGEMFVSIDEDREEVVVGSDDDIYEYTPNERTIMVPYEVPESFFITYSDFGLMFTQGQIVSELQFEFETVLIPSTSEINSIDILGTYVHQFSGWKIDPGRITLTPIYPYVTYSGISLEPVPEFNSIGYTIGFNDLSDY